MAEETKIPISANKAPGDEGAVSAPPETPMGTAETAQEKLSSTVEADGLFVQPEKSIAQDAPVAPPEAKGKEKKGKKEKKQKKEKKPKEPKQKKARVVTHRTWRERFAALAPEHFGDFFFLFLVAALAAGAALFWLYAWIPTHEIFVSSESTGQIPFFSDPELEDIVKILDARTEASTAPVVPPARDPFR